MVYEWGGSSAESPHPVDLHWSYPEVSIVKSINHSAVDQEGWESFQLLWGMAPCY